MTVIEPAQVAVDLLMEMVRHVDPDQPYALEDVIAGVIVALGKQQQQIAALTARVATLEQQL